MFKLAERLGSYNGVYCGEEGLYLGPAALIERRDGEYYVRSQEEITALLATAYESPPAAATWLPVLREIAMALGKAELGRAMIGALQLRVDDITEEAAQDLARTDELLKFNFNPLQPRDWHGRWSGASAGGLMPARAGGSTPRKPRSVGRTWERFPNPDFRNRLAVAEGNGDKPDYGYKEVRESNGALGRYQMLPRALLAAGMLDVGGKWTGKYGIHSKAQFLADRDAQERALSDFLADAERQLRANGAFGYLGSNIDGHVAQFTVTRAGLIAAAHRAGATTTLHYLRRVADAGFSSRALALDRNELAIETRLRAFADAQYQ